MGSEIERTRERAAEENQRVFNHTHIKPTRTNVGTGRHIQTKKKKIGVKKKPRNSRFITTNRYIIGGRVLLSVKKIIIIIKIKKGAIDGERNGENGVKNAEKTCSYFFTIFRTYRH